jgi:hypothetical protein
MPYQDSIRMKHTAIWYDYVGCQIAALIERFGLQASRVQIMQTYEDICGDSLAFSRNIRPRWDARINHDGTPIQYAVTLGSSQHTLQFLSTAGSPGITGAERMKKNRECMATIARRLHADEMLASANHLLATLAPKSDIDLLADSGGAYWVGAAFSASQESRLRIYINTRWGKEQDRWTRLSQFANYFNKSIKWRDILSMLASELQPLGMAITLNGKQPPSGRIYLSAYGKSMPFYEDLALKYGGQPFMQQMSTLAVCMLGDDYAYPTQTAVCSFGFGENQQLDFKFELCAHCLFSSDIEATQRLRRWFETTGLDATDYYNALDVLSDGYLSDQSLDLHCYAGIGLRHEVLYATIYLKPRFILP